MITHAHEVQWLHGGGVFVPGAGRAAQTTAFTYQGQLNSSNIAVTGTYDFRFRVFDVNSNVVAGPLTNAPVGVTNGCSPWC